ncbi:WhiB family transcriptional regulator, partial [Streptomyces rubiginosohelvolus]
MTELFQQLLVEDADEELGWQERALCAQTDPESFFPEKGGSTREAKKVCLACEVRRAQLEPHPDHPGDRLLVAGVGLHDDPHMGRV